MEEGVRMNLKAAAGTDLSAKRPVKVPGASWSHEWTTQRKHYKVRLLLNRKFKILPGNRPSTTLPCPALGPKGPNLSLTREP
jgi:hypothetical protein